MAKDPAKWKQFIEHVRGLILSARRTAARSVDVIQVFTNYRIGSLIIEQQQKGRMRAEYGRQILVKLSDALTAEFGRGFSRSNLEYMRRFYLLYRARLPDSTRTLSGKFSTTGRISQTASGKSPGGAKSQTPSGQLNRPNKNEANGAPSPFTLSWSHYVVLMGIDDERERKFYEIEATTQNWAVKELKRQFNSSLFERLALSRNKEKIRELSRKGQIVESPSDMIKEPCVLEFLGLDEREEYAEAELESAIINKLKHFLLELGKGFLFESRQRRFTFDGEHFYVDLVFYNRLLRCYVLVDLKLGRLTHQNLGQMQMYVNYFDRNIKKSDEHPTVGIVLCKSKSSALVEMTLPREANIYASEYKLYLPSKAELKKKLLEWDRENE